MSPTVGWGALSAALALLGGPSAARLRVSRLTSQGRLRGVDGARQRRIGRLKISPPRAAALLGAGSTVAAWVFGGPVLAVAAGALSGCVGWLTVGALARRAEHRHAAELLSAVRILVAELSAGTSTDAALAAAGEVAPAHARWFAAAAASVRGSGDTDEALRRHPDLAGLLHAWRLAERSGAPLAVVLERVADDLAARADQRRAVAAATAGARSSAVLLALLPLLGTALGAAMGADPFGFLLGSPTGRLVCLVGVVLDCAGALWTARLVSAAQRPER